MRLLKHSKKKKFEIFFATEKLKKPPQKVAYLSRNSVVSEIFFLLPYICPTAQMAEFMFQNVAYRATVYITGLLGKVLKEFPKGVVDGCRHCF